MSAAEEWFKRFPVLGEEPLFIIRGRLGDGSWFAVRAWQGPQCDSHTTLFCELRTRDGVIFPRESSWVGIPGYQTIDGRHAKESVVALFCLKPGDTDDDFFADYTEAQLDFVNRYAEELFLWKLDRFGESTNA